MSSSATYLGMINLSLIIIATLIFILIFIVVLCHRQELRDIVLVLTCNTCLAALLTCIAECIMTTSNLTTGFLQYNIQVCYGTGLLYDIFECLIYHSFCLQAFFRLCRVVFYKKKYLLLYSLYIILTIIQWLFTISLLLPTIFVNWYIHLPTEMYCLVPYTNIGASTYLIIVLYLLPLTAITLAYAKITHFIRVTTRSPTMIIATKQRQRNLRDLTVIKRIVFIVLILAVLRCPTIIFIIYGIIKGQLYPLTYAIVSIITSACLIIIGLITIYITPQLKKVILVLPFHRQVQVTPQQTAPRRLQASGIEQGNVIIAQQIRNTNANQDAIENNKF